MPLRTTNTAANFLGWILLGIIMSANQACAVDLRQVVKPTVAPEKSKIIRAPRERSIRVPSDTQAVLTLGADGKIHITDIAGKEFIPCILCPTSYAHKHPEDPHCDNLRKRLAKDPRIAETSGFNICGNRLTINSLSAITLMQTHKNPDCAFIGGLGTTVLSPENTAMVAYLRQILASLGVPPEEIDVVLSDPKSQCQH